MIILDDMNHSQRLLELLRAIRRHDDDVALLVLSLDLDSDATNGVIARRLWVTGQTVKFHLRTIFRTLDVANRTEASQLAHVRGLAGLASPPCTAQRPLLPVLS